MVLLMLDSLREWLEAITQEMRYQVKAPQGQQPEMRAPVIFDGYMPPKDRNQPVDEYPFVMPRCTGWRSEEDGKKADVIIYVGTHLQQGDGYRDALQLLERINTQLRKTPVIANKYRVELPITAEVPDEQPYPEWIGLLRCSVTIPEQIELPDEENERQHYGSGV